MGIILPVGVANFLNTPAAITDIIGNQMPAIDVPNGTIYIAPDVPAIYTNDNGTWVQLSGGGGGGSSTGINGLNGTTNIGLGGTLLNTTFIDGVHYDFTIDALGKLTFDSESFVFTAATTIQLFDANVNLVTLGIKDLSSTDEITLSFDIADRLIYATHNNIQDGLFIEFSNNLFIFGNFSNSNNQSKIIINDNSATLKVSVEGNTGQVLGINTDDGLLVLNKYGAGTYLNTPVYFLGVDINGNVIEGGNLQQTLNIGNTAVDTGIFLSDSAGYLTNVQVSNAANAILSTMAANYVGVQKNGSDNYTYLTMAGNTPFLINHSAALNRESRVLPDKLYFKDLTSGEIININAPATINNNTINFQNASGTIAFLSDIGGAAGIDDVLAVGQALTTTRSIDFNGNSLVFQNIDQFSALSSSGFGLGLFNSNSIIQTFYNGNGKGLTLDFTTELYSFGDTKINLQIATNVNELTCILSDNAGLSGIYVDYFQLINYVGWLSGVQDLSMRFDLNTGKIASFYNFSNKGLDLDLINDIYYFGATFTNGTTGFKADNNTRLATIGDTAGNGNGTNFGTNDVLEVLIGSPNLLGTIGTVTTDRIKININGTDYLIVLETL